MPFCIVDASSDVFSGCTPSTPSLLKVTEMLIAHLIPRKLLVAVSSLMLPLHCKCVHFSKSLIESWGDRIHIA